MAKKIIVQLVDDISGDIITDGETVSFALDGIEYTIDLTDENAAEFREKLLPYTTNGARQGGRKQARTGATAASQSQAREINGRIREWAAQNGHEVSERGRIPLEVKAAYEAATS